MIRVKIFRPSDNHQQTLNDLTLALEKVAEYWDKVGERVYGKPLDVNPEVIGQGWAADQIILIGAYDDADPNKLLGVLVGFKFRPGMFNTIQLNVEILYADDKLAYRALVGYLESVKDILGINRVYITMPELDTELSDIINKTIKLPIIDEITMRRVW